VVLHFTANQIGVLKVSHNIGSAQMTIRLLGGSYQMLNDSDSGTAYHQWRAGFCSSV